MLMVLLHLHIFSRRLPHVTINNLTELTSSFFSATYWHTSTYGHAGCCPNLEFGYILHQLGCGQVENAYTSNISGISSNLVLYELSAFDLTIKLRPIVFLGYLV
jgi:hypothetical protein